MWIYDDDYDDNVGDGRLCALCAETKILTETETETFSPILNFQRTNRDFFSRLNFPNFPIFTQTFFFENGIETALAGVLGA